MRAKRLGLSVRPMMIGLSLLIITASTAGAQSGRKIPKTPPKPPESTQPKDPPPDETKPAPEQKKDSSVPIMVAFQQDPFYNTRYYSGLVAQSCLERLQKAGGVSPRGGTEMNRKEASDAAKASADVAVLWFQIESDSIDPGYNDPRRSNTQSLYVNYVLYAPATGKAMSSGHIYQNQRGMLTRPLPQGAIAAEYTLRRAGGDL